MNIMNNYEILNPSSDQAFKKLFTGELRINGVSGKERAMSLLNSFLDFNNNYIVKLKYLFNLIPSILGENRKNLKVIDLPYLVTLSNKKKL